MSAESSKNNVRMQFRDAQKHIWILALPADEVFVYRGEERRFDEDTLKKIASETRRALYAFEQYTRKGSEPYRFPLLKEHERRGERYGYYDDVKVNADGLWVKAHPDQETLRKIRKNQIEYVSAGLDSVWSDQKGVEYGPILTELSLVSGPFFKSIGKIQDFYHVNFNDFANQIKEIPMEDQVQAIMAALDALMQRFDAMEARVGALEDPQEDPQEEEEIVAEDGQDEEEQMSLSDLFASLNARFDAIESRFAEQSKGRTKGRVAPPGQAPQVPPTELGAWIAWTAKTKGITLDEAARLSFSEFQGQSE